ncbi:MAG: 23S rRNA (guanosine(2251)-2'-O)-methyltransferase RlmB [Deltaproteobacteria bacterium]|nr:MAG: 23S rRNA (guanosine(2251)-2'-O)-methyltransferase RlmB [Deltaproteobacteria bacterium]
MMSSGRKEMGQGVEKRVRCGADLLWGIHPVYELLVKQPARIVEIFVVRGKRGKKYSEIIELCRSHGIKFSFVGSLKLTGPEGSQARHQGVVARVNAVAVKDFDLFVADFAEAVRQGQNPRVVVCDGLQDPHNIGAIIRSALASGAFGVVLTKERSAPLGGTAAKSSAGAISHIDVCQVTNLVMALQKLQQAGGWVFGTVKDRDAVSLYAADFKVPACIVVGSEGKGLRPLVKKQCDILVTIPMRGSLDSLNSSAAAAVVLFEALRQSL